MNPRPEVLIVGAGPAGAAAAILLAEQGFEVTVLDRARFPRDKVCGDGLAPRSVGVLRRLGVEERLRQAGHRPLGDYRIVSTWGDSIKAGLPSYGKGPPYAYVIPRREFDALLVERAREAGAEVIEGRRADRLIPGTAAAPAVETEDDGGRRIVMRPRVVVAADGSRGSFSRTVIPSRHLQPFAVAMRQYMDGAEGLDGALSFFLDRPMLPGYGWAFPASREGGSANVGAGMAVSALKRRGLK
ncbi:MAG TPA: FAD-dependent oxidoreductase, partial [Thermoleophilia bacterium]|nr:FAD-dependent oxidoreductase [Thermoleophilia bacterium]